MNFMAIFLSPTILVTKHHCELIFQIFFMFVIWKGVEKMMETKSKENSRKLNILVLYSIFDGLVSLISWKTKQNLNIL